ncbi:hypothetical protein PIB30_048484 [Stylosanthes scabra]|uniref:DUF4283 domain-containing protein n=1 Tax=Stylosanthes scabra TaxID=79078 RepID=A0ABU6RH60_9FABA|nr:hypothetical protein [Stylosanthes scabra]
MIECRGVGPFLCLLTFESEKTKEEAVTNQTLLSMFDEVRFHWGPVWSLSRRIWVEVMGLPTFVSLEETFASIAGLWGKFLIDSFEWEFIHEWVTVTVDQRKFDVFVKEFGGEVYSRESHPNKAEMAYMAADMSASETESMVKGTPTEDQNLPVAVDGGDGRISNNLNVNVDPVIEENPKEINEAIDEDDMSMGETMQRGEEAGNQNDGRMGTMIDRWACGVSSGPKNAMGYDKEGGHE